MTERGQSDTEIGNGNRKRKRKPETVTGTGNGNRKPDLGPMRFPGCAYVKLKHPG